MKRIAITILILAGLASAQSDLRPYRGKSAKTIANVTHGQKMDTTFFFTRVGDPARDLTSAIEKRAITPYDISAQTLQAAKDTAVVHFLPLLVPWNFTASTLTFKAADSALVLLCYGTINITENDTIPEGAQIIMRRSGRFNISSLKNLHIAGDFDGGVSRRFIGAGTVTFGDGAVDRIFMEWWGAKNDSTVDCANACQAAFNAGGKRSNVVWLLGNGKGYIINSTVRFPQGASGREILLEGNGAVIYSSANDTVLSINNVNSSTLGPQHPRHRVNNIWFKRIDGQEDSGVAIAISNTVESYITNCHFQDWRNAIGLINRNQGSENNGWTEGILIAQNRFTKNDSAILLKKFATGASFATTRIHNNDFSAGASARGKSVVHIGIMTNARLYGGSITGNYFGISDSTVGIYINGVMDGTFGYNRFETFGTGNQDESYYFKIGKSAVNLLGDWFVGYEGLNKTEFFIKADSLNMINFIRTQVLGEGNSDNRGISVVVNDSALTRIWSVIKGSNLNTYQTADSISTTSYDIAVDRTSSGVMTIRGDRSTPIDIVDRSDQKYIPVNFTFRRITRDISHKDSSKIDVRNAGYIRLTRTSSDAAKDSLTALRGTVTGQEVKIRYGDDSTYVANATGGTGSGRFLLEDARSTYMPTGTISTFISEVESGGRFLREIDRYYPMATASWNPGDLAAGATDSTTVSYWGAFQGDPVIVGFNSIGSDAANFDLKAHVINDTGVNNVRVFVTNRGGGNKNLEPGTLRYRIER